MNDQDASENDPAALLDNLEIVMAKSNPAAANADAAGAHEETLVVVNLKAKLRPEDQGELEDAFLEYCQSSDLPIEIIGGGSLVDDNGESIESVIEMVLIEVDKFADGIDHLIDHIIAFFEATLAPKGSSLTIYESALQPQSTLALQIDALEHKGAETTIKADETKADENKADENKADENKADENKPAPLSEVTQVTHSPSPEVNSADLEQAEAVEGRTVYFGHQEGLALYLNGRDLPQKIYQKYHIRQVFDKCEALLKGVGMVNSYWQGYAQTALYMYGDSYSEMVKRIEPVVSRHPLCQKSKIVQIA